MKWILAALALAGCSATKCQLLTVDVHELNGKPKPAGLVVIGCDGRKLLVVEAEKVGQ